MQIREARLPILLPHSITNKLTDRIGLDRRPVARCGISAPQTVEDFRKIRASITQIFVKVRNNMLAGSHGNLSFQAFLFKKLLVTNFWLIIKMLDNFENLGGRGRTIGRR